MSTLYVWFPASWAPMVAGGYLAGRPRLGGHPIHSLVCLPQSLPRRTPECISWSWRCWFQWGNGGY